MSNVTQFVEIICSIINTLVIIIRMALIAIPSQIIEHNKIHCRVFVKLSFFQNLITDSALEICLHDLHSECRSVMHKNVYIHVVLIVNKHVS